MACTCAENRFEPGAINIVLGYQSLPDASALRSIPCIVYQLEALPGQQGWLKLDDRKRDILQTAKAVWDYSPVNLAYLAEAGITQTHLLPIGYHPAQERIANEDPEYDVLFYGAINARRKAVLDTLAKRCRVKSVFGVYGEKRDRLIAKSRIVLNLHHNPAPLMEQVRVAFLLNNRRFVVTEASADNPYGGEVLTAEYEDLAETCLRALDDTPARDQWAERGYEFLKSRPMVDYLRHLLE